MDELLGRLAGIDHRSDLFNPYAGDSRASAVHRANLRRYWEIMAAHVPRVALVGEAPGYRGGRMTGIPFVSERLLAEPPAGSPFQAPGFALVLELGQPCAEATATMVWETIRAYEPLPLLWNSVPVHPHLAGDPTRNRAPRGDELQLGGPFLERVLALFEIECVVAVGRRAERALSRLDQSYVAVRHPSHGGKAAFMRGIRDLAAVGWCREG